MTSESMNEYYSEITTVRCHGDKCREHAYYGHGIHCTDCFGDVEDCEWKEIELNPLSESSSFIVINCHGDGCRNHGMEDLGLHCDDCFGPFLTYFKTETF
jgi:hypothetical protein